MQTAFHVFMLQVKMEDMAQDSQKPYIYIYQLFKSQKLIGTRVHSTCTVQQRGDAFSSMFSCHWDAFQGCGLHTGNVIAGVVGKKGLPWLDPFVGWDWRL